MEICRRKVVSCAMALALVLVLGVVALSRAHSLPVTASHWCLADSGKVSASIEVGPLQLQELLGIKEGKYRLPPARAGELQRVAEELLQPYLDLNLSVTVNRKVYHPRVERLVPEGDDHYTIWLSADTQPLMPLGNLVTIDYRLFFRESRNTHMNLAHLYLSSASGAELARLFASGKPVGRYLFEGRREPWSLYVDAASARPYPRSR
jgi:hypothetical protein